MDDLIDYYYRHKAEEYTKNETIQGIIKIAQGAGVLVGFGTVAVWLMTVAAPYLAGLGLPVTTGTVVLGLRALADQWSGYDEQTKRNICAAVKILSRFVNPFG